MLVIFPSVFVGPCPVFLHIVPNRGISELGEVCVGCIRVRVQMNDRYPELVVRKNIGHVVHDLPYWGTVNLSQPNWPM